MTEVDSPFPITGDAVTSVIRSIPLVAALAAALSTTHAQEAEPLRLSGLFPGGARSSVTEAYSVFQFTLANTGNDARQARVLVMYPGQPDVQFGRDIWIPAGAMLDSWLPIGPAPPEGPQIGRDIQSLLYDRTGGQDRLVLPPGEERLRTRSVLYRRREPATAIILDAPELDREYHDPPIFRPAGRPPVTLARTFRLASGFSEQVSEVKYGFLPPTPATFDSFDHVIVASNRLLADPPGLATLRHWVYQGGKLWILLDYVSTEALAGILGDDCDLQVVDRVSLTTVRVQRFPAPPREPEAIVVEEPIPLVRVLPGAADRVLFTVNGWPAAMQRTVGRGQVLLTTLGGYGWYRDRVSEDRLSPYIDFPSLPVPLPALGDLARELRPQDPPPTFAPNDLAPLLSQEIGYNVPSFPIALAVFSIFVVGLLGLALLLRRSRFPELAGWMGPVAALVTATVFIVLGWTSRRTAPPTAAAVALACVAPGTEEAGVGGLFALYHPESGPAELSTSMGAAFDIDTAGLDGQVRRRVQTDADSWHWENLALPAGVRSGPFHFTARGRMDASARFGPEGITGRLETGPFRHPADAVILTPAGEPIAVRLNADGTFSATPGDSLAPGQFLAGTVLTDRQQRRQEVYRRFLETPRPAYLEGRQLLLVWADLDELPMRGRDGVRQVGSVLMIMPLALERGSAGRVTVPSAFVPFRRVTKEGLISPRLDAFSPVEMRLRFQVPPAVLPLELERARLVARVRTPARRIEFAGFDGERVVSLAAADSPVEPMRIEITDRKLLQLDAQGGLHIQVSIGGGTDPRWAIESLTMDLIGQTGSK